MFFSYGNADFRCSSRTWLIQSVLSFSVRTSRSFFLIDESPVSFSRNFRHSRLLRFLTFLFYGHQTDLTTILCFCIHAVFCMQPFSICIHPCRNMDTSKPCCQADFSQTVGFQFCDRGIFRIIQHLKRNFCTFCRFSM